ncbi:MAG: TRAP transporter small permease [Firmicutes bacterium]|nr:TRAP transporter small permease [Bacillota bacterium]
MKFQRVAESLEWVGIAGLLLMLLFTVVDVAGSVLFHKPLRGATEWVGYMQIIAIAGAVAIGFYAKRHISIEFLELYMPVPVKNIVNKFVSIVCFAFFILLGWESFNYGVTLQKSGEVSSTAHIPLYPFAYYIAVAAVIASLYFVGRLLPAKPLQSRERSAERESG